MRKPVTSSEVEDVLASIRRLVSTDKRSPLPAETGEMPETRDETGSADDEKLVLTQSFRITGTEGPSARDAISADDDEGDSDSFEFGSYFRSDRRRAALAEQAFDSGKKIPPAPMVENVEAEPEQPAAAINLASFEVKRPEPAPADTGALESPDSEEQAETAPAADAEHSGPTTLGAKIAALEAVVGKRDENWEPDGVEGGDYSGTRAPSLAWDKPEADGTPPDADDTDTAGDTAEPVEASAATMAAAAAAPASRPETESDERPAPDAVAPQAPRAVPSRNGDEADILDEETLREMVAEIVRQELKGTLGERITRNVRKLVRREILRVLHSQNLD